MAACVCAVATLHVLLLDGWLEPQRSAPQPALVMQVRQVRHVQQAQQVTVPPAAMPRAVTAVAAPRPQLQTTTAHDAQPAEPITPIPIEATPPAASPEAAATHSSPPPVYPTAPPPSLQLHYLIERGAQQGQAVIDWSHDDSRYLLRMSAELAGRAVLGSTSRGTFDHAGLAPERFVETRRQRELRAANFEREAGHIAFSGPGHTAALTAGAQDRLSWIVQLAAVLQADPAREEVRLSVTGARGDSTVWRFVIVAGREADDGVYKHFRRDAEHAHDTQVDVWLDPAEHYLPARLRLVFHERGEATTFLRVAR